MAGPVKLSAADLADVEPIDAAAPAPRAPVKLSPADFKDVEPIRDEPIGKRGPGARDPDAPPLEAGNVNLSNRPHVKNADGSISTVRSMGFEEDGKQILVPTVSDDGRIMSDAEAIDAYHRTGKHLGKFGTIAESNAAAQRLHEDEAAKLEGRPRAPDGLMPTVAPPVKAGKYSAKNPDGTFVDPTLNPDAAAFLATMRFGSALADTAKRPIQETLSDPEKRRELGRGVSDVTTLGLAQRAGEAVDPKFAATAAPDAAAAPGYRDIGASAGAALPNPVAKVAGVAGRAMGRGLEALGGNAEGRVAGRAMEKMEERTLKRTRAGIEADPTKEFVSENPAVKKAAGNDAKLADVLDGIKAKRGAELNKIYGNESAGAFVPADAPVENINRRIVELDAGTSEDRAVARQLETIRDEFAGSRKGFIDPKELRAEQSAYQRKGFGKSLPGDDAGTARIAANREASKAVGDALIKHITGMDYEAAQIVAKADPTSIAGRLLAANADITAATRLEAGIADRATRVQPKHGLTKIALEIKHSPTGFALSKAPEAVAKGAEVADRALAALARAARKGGEIPPETVQAALDAGVKATTVKAITSRAQATP